MDDALRQAVMGAQNIQSPESNLGASQAPELAQLFQSTFQLPQSNQATGALAEQASEQVAYAKAQAAAAKAAAKKKQDDMADPKAYRKVRKEDGGFDFVAPDGSLVDIATLTQRTGTRAMDWIDDSENPIDIQYLEDYQNLQDYAKSILGKNKAKVDSYRAAAPELRQYDGVGGVNKLIETFKKNYERYYVPRSQDQNAWGRSPGRTVVPTYSSGDEEDLTGYEGL